MTSELKLASVRFKDTGKMYFFSTDLDLKAGDNVIVETARGIEFGELIDELKKIEDFNLNTELKKVVRKASKEDIDQYNQNQIEAKEALKICSEIIERRKLNMHLTNCEFTLDRSKVIFMYTADNRVDFRDLLKELAVVFRCRIELRQIGPRDKAKIVGGIGVCGLPLCCTRIMSEFNGVSINMAKNQMLAINIEKISGNCGRLLCCLKYEDDLYTEAKKKYPRIGSTVKFEKSIAKVIGYNIISDLIKLDVAGNIIFVHADEIEPAKKPEKEKEIVVAANASKDEDTSKKSRKGRYKENQRNSDNRQNRKNRTRSVNKKKQG